MLCYCNWIQQSTVFQFFTKQRLLSRTRIYLKHTLNEIKGIRELDQPFHLSLELVLRSPKWGKPETLQREHKYFRFPAVKLGITWGKLYTNVKQSWTRSGSRHESYPTARFHKGNSFNSQIKVLLIFILCNTNNVFYFEVFTSLIIKIVRSKNNSISWTVFR